MDEIYERTLNQSPRASERHSNKLMQFSNNKNDSCNSHANIANNNNNEHEKNIFQTNKNSPIKNNLPTSVTHTTATTTTTNNSNSNNSINKGSNDRLTGSTSPSHLSSNSSVSSQAQNNDDCDLVANHRANNSSPSSPQSSYNSSYGSNSGQKLINCSNSSITSLVPGGVVTTQNISTVIKPKGNTNSLQFVKIQTPELSKKAVEQIKMAEDSKINKEKIKEVEEEWQNNLLNWKSKRRQQFNYTVDQEPNNPFEANDSSSGRKIKTFAEMIEQRAKSGNRLGFHLQRYIGAEDEEVSQPDSGETKTYDEPDRAENKPESDDEVNSGPTSPLASDLNSTETTEPAIKNNANTDLVSTKSDENKDSGSEEVEGEDEEDEVNEQEEEQKQKQRIAFEAKLKAFEKLTKPTPAPKFIPNRVARNSTTPTQNIPPKVDVTPKERQNLPSQQYQRMQQQPQPKPQLPSPVKVTESIRPNPVHLETKQEKPISSENSTPIRSITNGHRLHSTPNEPSPVSPVKIDKSLSQKSIDDSLQRVQESFKQVNIVQKPAPAPTPIAVHQPPSELISKTIPKVHNNSFNQVSNIVQKPRSIVNQPLPESPKNVPSQRKLPRDDKDRTVLSVSGKKRCSSCKEELGRGAAAFVVESLSLVYHTNCFRCSVCHANLSNGFRGVDVRVHAGALHCQNCYSKDGLNYSRV